MAEIYFSHTCGGRLTWSDPTVMGIRWRVTAAGGKVLQFMTIETWREADLAGQDEIWTDVPEEFMP